jgi:hypothetical protein
MSWQIINIDTYDLKNIENILFINYIYFQYEYNDKIIYGIAINFVYNFIKIFYYDYSMNDIGDINIKVKIFNFENNNINLNINNINNNKIINIEETKINSILSENKIPIIIINDLYFITKVKYNHRRLLNEINLQYNNNHNGVSVSNNIFASIKIKHMFYYNKFFVRNTEIINIFNYYYNNFILVNQPFSLNVYGSNNGDNNKIKNVIKTFLKKII